MVVGTEIVAEPATDDAEMMKSGLGIIIKRGQSLPKFATDDGDGVTFANLAMPSEEIAHE